LDLKFNVYNQIAVIYLLNFGLLFAFILLKNYFATINYENKMKNELLYHFFSDDDFLDISNKIKETETVTSGEIRVAIKEKAPFLKNNKDIKELAADEFYKLGMASTRDKTGILIYILLSKRMFYILADSGINEKVEQSTWDKIRDEMESDFKIGNYLNGILSTISKVGNILGTFFPIKEDDSNELSNKVIV
jgi:uncharacterized membrane protein